MRHQVGSVALKLIETSDNEHGWNEFGSNGVTRNKKSNRVISFVTHVRKLVKRGNSADCSKKRHFWLAWKKYDFAMILIEEMKLFYQAFHCPAKFSGAQSGKKTAEFKLESLRIWLQLGLGPLKRNLWLLSKFSQNTFNWFQASFRRVLGVLVTW